MLRFPLPVGEEARAPECRAIAHLIVDALQGIVYTHRNQVIARICIRQNVNRPFRIRDLSVPLARGLTQGGEFVHVIFDSRYREELTTVPEGANDRPLRSRAAGNAFIHPLSQIASAFLGRLQKTNVQNPAAGVFKTPRP